MTPIKAIRARCLDCACGSATEVRLCPCTDCALWPYRLGHRPKVEGASTSENSEIRGTFSADEAGGVNIPGKGESRDSGGLTLNLEEQNAADRMEDETHG